MIMVAMIRLDGIQFRIVQGYESAMWFGPMATVVPWAGVKQMNHLDTETK